MPTVTVIQPIIAAEQNTKIRCAAYCRVSSDSEDQLNSFMAQTRYYSQVFKDSETEELIDIYADEGITGTREDKRDEFQRMIKDCRRGKIDRIYTKSISRFSRNTRDCLKNVRELKSLGITIYFEKENIDTAKLTDEMMITIMGGLAQEESTSISQNMRWSVQKRMQNGTYRNSCPPFGYTVQNDTLIVNEEQAKFVKQIFNWYNEGYGLQAIADTLNNMAAPRSQTAERWYASSVRYVLSNERYIGDALFQKKYRTETLPTMQKRNRGEKPKYYVQSVNTPIIDKDIFYSVQELLNKRHREYINNNHFLSKRILCSKCGATYKYVSSKNSVFWTCRTHNNNASDCSNGRISEIKIYETFVGLCNKLLYNYKSILIPLQTALQDLKLKKFSGKTQVMDIHKEIAELREQTHILARLKTKGFLDEAKYIEQTTELTAKINKLQAELKKLTRSDDEDETLDQIEILIDFFEKRDSPMTEFEETAFESMVEKIVVKSQNELEFHLIGGLQLGEYC